jgi:hypothetical protein
MEGHYQEPANQLDSLLSSQNFRSAVLGDSVQTQSSAPHVEKLHPVEELSLLIIQIHRHSLALSRKLSH